MTQLTPQQIKRLRKPFDEVGAFEGLSDREVEQVLNGAMNIWLTLARINLRLRQEKNINGGNK